MTQSAGKPWKYALAQHPMWLLIDEDTVCAERTPPWGSPSLEDYSQRLGVGLEAIEKNLSLHLNFDFSAVELEDAELKYPKLVERMRKLTKQGRVSFVNGTYSQPHLQILSIESTIRQYLYGLEIIEKLVGYKVNSYSAQEPGYTPQLPQILRAFGFKTSSTCDFPMGIKIEKGQIQLWNQKWEWLQDDDFINWVGPDGSSIPLWLRSYRFPNGLQQADEVQRGMLKRPRLRVDMPDMVEVSPEWVQMIESACEFVQLDKTLEEMTTAKPPTGIGSVDANYAYSEGGDAEGLSRANYRAESALLSLEALESFLPAGKEFDYTAAWKTLLKTQHHDAYWIGGPELRAKSIAWLEDVTKSAEMQMAAVAKNLAKSLPKTPGESRAVVVLSSYAKKHTLPVEVSIDSPNISLKNDKGRKTPVQTLVRAGGSTRAVFVNEAKGLGYSTLFLQSERKAPRVKEKAIKKPYTFSNAYYSVSVRPDGSIASVAPKGGRNLLKKGDGLGGNQWLFKDTTALREARAAWGPQASARDMAWERVGKLEEIAQASLQSSGADVLPKLNGSAKVVQGPVFDLVESPVQLGPARLINRLFLYHALPWFQVETELIFDDPAEIGDYFDDRTKLHHAWAVGDGLTIRHAVGGALDEARQGKSFLVSPWVDVSDKKGGLAVAMSNSARCWLDDDGWLRCLVAWGHEGEHFHNRQGPLKTIMGPLHWFKVMDLRLRGAHTVKYAVWPHNAKVGEVEIADWAASLLLPPTAHAVETGGGQAPWSETFVGVKTTGVIPLSARQDGDAAILRLMDVSGKTQALKLELSGGRKAKDLRNLDGTKASKIGPHKIVEARIE